jgi:hypothetical protein
VRLTYWLKFLVLTCLAIISWQAVSAQASVFIEQPSYYLQTPDEITLQINIDDMYYEMRGYQVRFSFDTEYLEVSGTDAFHQGAYLSDIGLTSWNVSGSDGEYTIGCAILGLTNGSVGPGNLFSVTIRPKKNTGPEGTDTILSGVILRDVLNNDLPVGPVEGSNIVIDAFHAYAGFKVFLQGPYIVGGQMRHDITSYLPLTSPYDGQQITALPDVTPHYIVDWVYVGLRILDTEDDIVSVNAFALDDGYLIDLTGNQCFRFDDLPQNEFYITIKHRNHLGIISSNPQTLSPTESGVVPIDLTGLDSIYGGNVVGAKEVETGVLAMFAGDADMDGAVFNTDRNLYWRPNVGFSGYQPADFNLDGNVFNTDLNLFWRLNFGRETQIP